METALHSKLDWRLAALPVVYALLFAALTWKGDDTLLSILKLLPFAALGFYLIVFHTRLTFWLTVLLTPLSVKIEQALGGSAMAFPSEAIVWVMAFGLLAKAVWHNWMDVRILKHPLTLIVLLQLFWITVTTVSSTYQVASFKLLLARVIFILVFFLFIANLSRQFRHIPRFLWLYIVGSIPITIIAFSRLAAMGFARQNSPVMASPWFSDHTVYGVCMAMLFPFVLLWYLNRKKTGLNSTGTFVSGGLSLFLALGILFSFSRASWLSIILGAGVYMLIWLRVNFVWMVMIFGTAIGAFFSMEFPAAGSSEPVDKDANTFVMTVQSITDLERDESNLERINRWNCAIRMYQAKPFFGWGPGTYEMFYAPFQITHEMTRISTMIGDRGDAHSEYLTALSEQGIPGLVIFILFILGVFYTGLRVVYTADTVAVRITATGLLIGLFTFFFHGAVNSFMDVDKAATLIWSFCGMLVGMDIYHRKYVKEAENL